MITEKFKDTEVGLIPIEWEIIKLSEISNFRYGRFIPKKDLFESGFPVFSGYAIVGYLPTFEFEESQLLIVCRGVGGTGDVKISPPLVTVTNLSIIFNLKGDVDKSFLYWKLKSMDTYSLRTGSAQPQITIKDLESFKISIPHINEQKEISRILNSIENKIDLNQKMNQTLEEIGQAIFKHWFVHFEFPNEDGKPYKSSGGEMVDSELGKIPKGWDIKELPEVTKIVDCLHTKKPEHLDSDNILLQVYNIAEDSTIVFDKLYTVSDEDYAEWTKNILLDEGDCVITNAGRVGAVGRVPKDLKAGIGRNITAIRPEKISSIYLFRYLVSSHGKNQILFLTDQGTILNSLNVKGIKKIKIIVPPDDILKSFGELILPLREKVELNVLENETIAQIRDSILPKLMSGKIRVPLEGK